MGERGGGQEQQRERREQKSKAGPYTLPNSRSPASGGNYHVNIYNINIVVVVGVGISSILVVP